MSQDNGLVSSVPKRLKEALSIRNMKQIELANLTGLDKGSISNYLSGRYEPKQVAIYKMSRALNVSEAWLMGFDVVMDRPILQKENDELADLIQKIKKEEDFRSLVIRISKMESSQIEAIKSFLTAFPLK